MSELPSEAVWKTIEASKESMIYSEKIRKLLAQFDTSLRLFEEYTKSQVLNSLSEFGPECIDSAAWKSRLARTEQEVLGFFNSIYHSLEQSPFICKHTIFERCHPYCEEADNELEKIIRIAISGNILIVRTPHLLNTNTSYWRIGKRNIPVNHRGFFAREVERKLDRYQGHLPQYSAKNISVISCYHSDRNELPDTENLDKKQIIDAIVIHFPGSDDGDKCSLFQACLYRDDIEEGCYFVVSEGFGTVPNLEVLISELKRVFYQKD